MSGAISPSTLSRLGLDPGGRDPFPRRPAPMLLGRRDALFASAEWTYEPKWDGFRVLASMRGGVVHLLSRNGHSFTDVFGPVSETLRSVAGSALLDGEVVAVNSRGRPDFQALQARLRPRNGKLPGHICYMLFDCLYVDGHSLLDRPLEERQVVLQELAAALPAGPVQLTEGFAAAHSARLMRACARMGLEGVVMKRKGSPYRPGVRSADWLKVPIRHRDEFVVGGYLPNRYGFRTLILGQFDRRGNLEYAGFCGIGLSTETRAWILEALISTGRKTCPFRTVPHLRDGFGELPDMPPQWVRPALVVEVEYRQRMDGALRHGVLKGLRPDRQPRHIRRDAGRVARPSAS